MNITDRSLRRTLVLNNSDVLLAACNEPAYFARRPCIAPHGSERTRVRRK